MHSRTGCARTHRGSPTNRYARLAAGPRTSPCFPPSFAKTRVARAHASPIPTRSQSFLHKMVGRPPWSAADALVGLRQWRERLILRAKSGTRASRADRGVRPTNPAALHLLEIGRASWRGRVQISVA